MYVFLLLIKMASVEKMLKGGFSKIDHDAMRETVRGNINR
jgi:hypothetical protein